MRGINIIVAIIALTLVVAGADSASAQRHEERKLVREGNREFNNKEYAKGLAKYNEALEVDPDCMEAKYNRANAYHHVARKNSGLEVEKRDTSITWERSNALFEELIADKRLSKEQRAEVYRNVGMSLMRQQQHEAALNAFRESLLLNPNDQDTKYNYVLAKRIVDQKRQQNQNQDQNQNGQGGGDNQENQNDQNNQGGGNGQDDQNDKNDQNQDENNQGGNGDQDKDQKGDNQDNKGDGDKQNDNQKGDNQENKGDGDEPNDNQDDDGDSKDGEGGEEPQPAGLSDEQERLLDAIQGEEDKTQEKVNKERGAIYVRGKKNW
jgi:tetratricopeptide (TPR) repeat protein